ncbi:MAG TPA: CvpA family protein [Steroidobacteraceae bacterium]|jgi:membrane protein required for colicin V production
MNWIDYLLIALIVFCCIAGLMRGLLREAISLVTWIVAVWIGWSYAGLVEPHLGGALANENVRTWVARALVFLAVLLVGNTLGLIITHFVRLSLFNRLDRAFGALFGLLRGLIMIGLFVILCHAVRLDGEQWWRESLLMPYAERAANVLRGMVGESKIHTGDSITAAR